MGIDPISRSIVLPDGKTIEAMMLNKKEVPVSRTDLAKYQVELEDHGIFGHGEDVFLWEGKCLVNLSKDLFLLLNDLADYIKVIKGSQHFNALVNLRKDSTLRVSYNMFDSSIADRLKTSKYTIDSVSFPSKFTTENGGYKTYIFEDGSVGYFYLFEPKLGRYMGWWHENIETFEWFYHNVYELTGVFPN